MQRCSICFLCNILPHPPAGMHSLGPRQTEQHSTILPQHDAILSQLDKSYAPKHGTRQPIENVDAPNEGRLRHWAATAIYIESYSNFLPTLYVSVSPRSSFASLLRPRQPCFSNLPNKTNDFQRRHDPDVVWLHFPMQIAARLLLLMIDRTVNHAHASRAAWSYSSGMELLDRPS